MPRRSAAGAKEGRARHPTRFLFETPLYDPLTLAVVVVLLGVAACIAARLPARRAALVDPLSALRAE